MPRIPTLTGVDTQLGLSRLQNDWDIYKKILIVFRDMQHSEPFVEIMRSHIANNEFNEAQHLAHTLKGASGNIGADELFKASSILEIACKDKNINDIEASLLTIDGILNPMLISLDTLKETVSLDDRECDMNNEEIYSTLLNLINNFDKDLNKVEEYTNMLSPCMKNNDVSPIFNEMLVAIEDFNIDKAKEISRTIEQKLKSTCN